MIDRTEIGGCFGVRRAARARVCGAAAAVWLALALSAGGVRGQTAWEDALPGVSDLSADQRPLSQVAPYRRFLWVSRFDWSTAADVKRIFYQAAQARFSDVLFQVRGEGTAYFQSEVEPWAWQLSGGEIDRTGRKPGWDPLATAIEEARRYGLRVHAYINVMPGWAQLETAPESSGQLFAARRSWFMQDMNGNAMDPRRLKERPLYAFVDPALPEVRGHLAKLAGDLAGRYAVDGLHLDYIRYPHEHPQYSSYGKATRAAFQDAHGGTPAEKPQEWRRFMTEQITAVVRGISLASRRARPGIEMSAAIMADDVSRANDACQDAEGWLREGLVDAVAPMAYTGEMRRFDAFCERFSKGEWRGKVWLGVWAKADRNPELVRQVRNAVRSGFPGVAIFSYSELFPDRKVNRRVVALYQVFTGKPPS
jgi:uncharacterized lipoprotein YddW (UPF0748 family)